MSMHCRILMKFPTVQKAMPTIVVLLTSLAVISDAGGQASSRFAFTRPLMGTDVRVVLYAVDSLEAIKAAESAFSRVEKLNDILSDYLIESELSQLSNTYNQSVTVTEDLWNVLSTAQEIARLSAGDFDVTIGPLTFLWRRAMRRAMLPDSIALRQAMAVVGFDFLQLNASSKTAKLDKKNMRLDLGGIAKGYVADQALEVLVQEGFSNVAVDVGGDIALGKAPPDTDGWSIEVFKGQSEAETVILANCGIAVSGDTYQYLEHQGVRYSHIVDPETGYGVTHERKVAVIAPNAMMADAWASTYSVMDWQTAILNIQDQNILSVRMVEPGMPDSRQHNTGQFKRR